MLDENELNGTAESFHPRDFLVETEQEEIIKFLETCDDQTVRSRLRAVLFYIKGYGIDRILEEAKCSRSSLLNWFRAYRQQGPEGLFDRRQGGNNARLSDEQIQDLVERLRNRAPQDLLGQKTATPDGKFWTVEDLCTIIWQWYGVTYKSRTSYYNLIKKLTQRNGQESFDRPGNATGDSKQPHPGRDARV
jgi:transposase